MTRWQFKQTTNPRRLRSRRATRRGVSSVLAMMFMVIFGSLAAAMAVVAQGNLRTADSALKVSRAMSAAETGLVFAQRRLASESSRFVVEKGVIDTDFAHELWLGTYNESADGAVTILPANGYAAPEPDGIMHAVRDAHLADSHDIVVEAGDSSLPELDDTFGTLRVRPIQLGNDQGAPYFRLKYELVSGEPMVRVTSQGVDGDIRRTLQMDFRIDKKIEYAILSPNRIMIGKNVHISGPLGTRYGIEPGELDPDNGDPLVMRSDFYYLDSSLDTNLDTLYAEIIEHDVDGDTRLRPNHPVEALGVAASPVLLDYNGDEYVDDFDLFLAFYDANDDQRVVYDPALASAAGHGLLTAEFEGIDDQLARLIDETLPDRDGDDEVTFADTQLGYRDGILDVNDLYAKIHGRVAFAVVEGDWETAHGASYQTVVYGPVSPGIDEAAVGFEVDDEDLREITTDMLSDTKTWFEAQATGSFGDDSSGQVAAGISAGGTYTEQASAPYESVPYEAQGAYDYYQRPIYEDMTFTNVRIPMGTNALFENCTFIGVTFIEIEEDCAHENWNYTGALTPIDPDDFSAGFDPKFPYLYAESGGSTITDTRLHSNNIRFNDCTFLGSVAGDKPEEYTHWRNKIQFTGNTRFYIDPEDEDLQAQPDASTLETQLLSMSEATRTELAKSSILMPGWSIDVGNFTNVQAANPEDTPVVKLQGVIVAGIMDVRGTAEIHGTMVMTFRPVEAQGPLFYGGQTDAFNTTIGYFGPADGDNESAGPDDVGFNGFGEIRIEYDPDVLLPDGIPWPVHTEAQPLTYTEGGSI